MKFQDSSLNGLKVTVGTKSVTHAPTHAPKAICPINFSKVRGIIKIISRRSFVTSGYKDYFWSDSESRTPARRITYLSLFSVRNNINL